jgi:hypothetical protein
MACRSIITLKPVLDVRDKRRQYFAHVSAIRTRKAIINVRQPSPPGRLEHHRKYFQWMQRAMLRAGEDNLKLIDQARHANCAIHIENNRDWIDVIARQRLTRPAYGTSVRPPLTPLTQPTPSEDLHDEENPPEQGTHDEEEEQAGQPTFALVRPLEAAEDGVVVL